MQTTTVRSSHEGYDPIDLVMTAEGRKALAVATTIIFVPTVLGVGFTKLLMNLSERSK